MDEIRKLVSYPDRRIKPIIYTMSSSGTRIGAWNSLQWKHISPIYNEIGEVIAAKMIVCFFISKKTEKSIGNIGNFLK